MQDRYRYDAAIKDLFQVDKTMLLDLWTGERAVTESLNVEFVILQERAADLVLALSDETILHIDFQSTNDPRMATRMGIYCFLIHDKYQREVHQVVLYIGQPRLTMTGYLYAGSAQESYRLVDIREFDVGSFLKSGRPGDLALALLARDGVENLAAILEAANRLDQPARLKALTQMTILSGLRGASEKLTMELKQMGVTIDIESHAFLREIRDTALAQGEAKGIARGLEQGLAQGVAQGVAQGIAQGEAKGMAGLLCSQIEERFGPIPAWAADRATKATSAELQRWARQVLTAPDLDSVFH